MWVKFQALNSWAYSLQSGEGHKAFVQPRGLFIPQRGIVELWVSVTTNDGNTQEQLAAYQRKFRNLTSDYTESCCWRSVQEMWSRRCDTAEMWDMRIWRVGSARNAVFFAGWESQVLRTGGRGGSAAQDVEKFAPRLRARAIWKSKSLKTGMVGALLEVEVAKICTTPARESDSEVKIVKAAGFGALFEVELTKICTMPARESDLEVKIVKKWEVRSTFGSWSRQNLHHACARERFGSQNR